MLFSEIGWVLKRLECVSLSGGGTDPHGRMRTHSEQVFADSWLSGIANWIVPAKTTVANALRAYAA